MSVVVSDVKVPIESFLENRVIGLGIVVTSSWA